MAKVSIEALNKTFDDRRIARVIELSDKRALQSEWAGEHSIHLNAKRHGNLRNHVRDTFLRLCPYAELTNALRPNTDEKVAVSDAALAAIAEALEADTAAPAPAADNNVVSFAEASTAATNKRKRPGGKKARKAAKGGQKTA